MYHLDNPYPKFLGSVEHKVWNDDEDANSGSKIVSCLSKQRVPSERDERVGDSVKKTVRGARAMILDRDIVPDVSKVGSNAAGECETAHGLFLFAS
jgi:hypothetical protein